MRFQKLLIVSATMLASTTLAGLSFADNTPSATSPTTSSSVTVPNPTAPATSTTVTTQAQTSMTPGATTQQPPTTPTSTTTTTSAEDVSAAAPMPPVTSTPMTSGETTTVYQHQRPNRPLLITGSALLVGTYATTAAVSGANGPVADRDLYIPIVGPWINIADRDTNRPDNTRDTLLIAGSGVLQGIGAALIVTSIFVPESVPAARISAGNVKMQVTPTAGYGSGGLGAVGTF